MHAIIEYDVVLRITGFKAVDPEWATVIEVTAARTTVELVVVNTIPVDAWGTGQMCIQVNTVVRPGNEDIAMDSGVLHTGKEVHAFARDHRLVGHRAPTDAAIDHIVMDIDIRDRHIH